MFNRASTADLLEAQIPIITNQMDEPEKLLYAVRTAIHHLRWGQGMDMYTEDDVRAFAGVLAAGGEIACYIERKGYYKPEGCIVYAMRGRDRAAIMTSMGTDELKEMGEYNRTWRLWNRYPSGPEMRKTKWLGAEAEEKKEEKTNVEFHAEP